MSDLLQTLAQRLGATLRSDRRFHADCPFCGKEAKRGQKHFSFAAEGYKCWVCEAHGGLAALADRLDVAGPRTVASRPAPAPAAPRAWQTDPRVLARATGALDTLTAWQAYKPLSLATIARARLGVGVLPASRCTARRLILPVFAGGRLVALHGRAFLPGDDDAKWLTAGGSRKDVLYGADDLKPGATVIVCENLVDSLMVREQGPGLIAVAAGGVAWRPAFTAQIAASRPAHVLVWLDHDLVGNGSRWHHEEMVAEWRRKNPKTTAIPEAQGPHIANALLEAGVKASVYQWPRGTPPKADLGWALMQERGARSPRAAAPGSPR